MTCKLCQIEPVYKLPNKTLCKRCFIKYFENKVFKTIRKYELFELDDKLVVAVSGGKDSISVLYLTHKYLKKKILEKNITALAIDEGIKNYRKKTLKFLKQFCKDLNIKLEIITFKNIFNKTLDESVKILQKQKNNISPCNICGTFRRQALNIGARKLNATKLVTGHNTDDEAQNILLNIFKNNFKILTRLGPYNGILRDELFIPRVKPLYLITEKEVRLYTILKGFDVGFDECPYAKETFRGNISTMINKLEDEHKGVKNSIINFYLKTQYNFKQKFFNENDTIITYCEKCKEPSQNKICNTCKLKELIRD
ncbi:MAG: TIGR00269 family protein [Nanoarchaeota archaeon]